MRKHIEGDHMIKEHKGLSPIKSKAGLQYLQREAQNGEQGKCATRSKL